MALRIPYQMLFEEWLKNSSSNKFDALMNKVFELVKVSNLKSTEIVSIKARIRAFSYKMQCKWNSCSRHYDTFVSKNVTWLQGSLYFPQIILSNGIGGSGRRRKAFDECSSKTKRRRALNLIEKNSPEEVKFAAEVAVRREGKRDSARVIKELSKSSPRRGTMMKRSRKLLNKTTPTYSADRALAVIIDGNLSTHQYNTIRNGAKEMGSKLYPPYHQIIQAKENCYPCGIEITEIFAEIPLQSLIDHTVTRLIMAQKEVFDILHLENRNEIKIIIKWGCDGANQKQYKQKFSDDQQTDSSLFSISFVPIQILANKQIIWQNPVPSSTKYCRPIKCIFGKETKELVTNEVTKIENQIQSLSSTKVFINDVELFINPVLIFCMIDGKICNIISGCASNQTCYLCGAKPVEMNNLTLISAKKTNEKFLSFGLSPLHARIRFLECILHISYRLSIFSWQVRGKKNKEIVAQRKKQVQDDLRKELGLLVDMPNKDGGNTNDGNTSRKFFREYKKTSKITGVNEDLIKRFKVILEVINSGFEIDENKFEEYAKATRELYVREYHWYRMPVTVHKILCHGKEIISTCILPIGQLSEEAQETRNKHNRKFREMFTRKTSRIHTNTDLLHRLLISSDPYIASLRSKPKTTHATFSADSRELLKQPPVVVTYDINSSSDNVNESESDSIADSE